MFGTHTQGYALLGAKQVSQKERRCRRMVLLAEEIPPGMGQGRSDKQDRSGQGHSGTMDLVEKSKLQISLLQRMWNHPRIQNHFIQRKKSFNYRS